MKIMFLDFDGVLNSHQYMVSPRNKNKGLIGLDPENVQVLNKVFQNEPDLKIVVSSAWRIGRNIWTLRDILSEAGFLYPERVIDKTPNSSSKGSDRGYEIYDWMDKFPVNDEITAYVIVDDSCDMAMFMHKLVRTSHYDHGLKECHVTEILEQLKV